MRSTCLYELCRLCMLAGCASGKMRGLTVRLRGCVVNRDGTREPAVSALASVRRGTGRHMHLKSLSYTLVRL